MEKQVFTNLKSYTFNSERKGAKYTFDGEHYLNNGEFIECQYKHCLGYDCKKDGNTPFDMGSDIEQLERSIKSSKAELTSVVLGKDLETSLDCYFERTASMSWAWVVIIDGALIAYVMDSKEYREFIEKWAGYRECSHTVRFKITSGKMLKWLEERA